MVKFEGVINGIILHEKMTQSGGSSFEFSAEGKGANLDGIVNPLTIGLAIGDDGGTTNLIGEFRSTP